MLGVGIGACLPIESVMHCYSSLVKSMEAERLYSAWMRLWLIKCVGCVITLVKRSDCVAIVLSRRILHVVTMLRLCCDDGMYMLSLCCNCIVITVSTCCHYVTMTGNVSDDTAVTLRYSIAVVTSLLLPYTNILRWHCDDSAVSSL